MGDMATMDTMARGPLRLSLDMVIMVRDLLMLSQLPLLSQDMDMVMDMAMDILATDMVVMDTMDIVMDMAMDMDMVTMDTMARDLLSQDMDIMAMVMDTMVKQICCSSLEFSTNEVGLYRSSQNTH